VRAARGEIIVFSDANIFYQRDTIRRLVRNFADAEVGCVTGDSRYVDSEPTEAYAQENAYWGYERFIRSMESRLGSTVGGDGAIFAIRRELYAPLPAEAINDLVVPLRIVSQGYRAVFEPAAIGIEPTSGDFGGEFRRKRRIVNRSWHGVMSVSEVLNPGRVCWFAWQVWSHKILRWLVLPVILLGVGGCFIALPLGLHYRIGAWGFVASLVLAGFGALAPARWGRVATLLHAAWYFYLVNLAAVLGIAMALVGRVEMIWTPERGWDVNAR
jgi:cellulose synthase/poly-beta-1,6-N-acetylglucosamine synthase-like glycosyltransferase